MDYYIINGLYLKYGYDPDDLAALLMYASGKAAERGIKYVTTTVSHVCQPDHPGTHP